MSGLTALTREVSTAITQCELTHVSRTPIDLDRARAQHAAYEEALRLAGCAVHQLKAGADMPDAVFIEDTAIVLDEIAIITRPGALSRRVECAAVEAALAPHRRLARIESPGTIDGGDVLVMGRTIFIGVSSRTNASAVEQVRALVVPLGYAVRSVTVRGCLHLKSAVTAMSDAAVLMNRAWAPADVFDGYEIVDVDADEPYAANVVAVGDRLIYPTAFPRTLKRLEAHGLQVTAVDASELAKAEGAVTCCSLILRM